MPGNDEFREYLFEYDHEGATWCITIKAASADDARARMKRMSLARFVGEGVMSIPLPGFFERLFLKRKTNANDR